MIEKSEMYLVGKIVFYGDENYVVLRRLLCVFELRWIELWMGKKEREFWRIFYFYVVIKLRIINWFYNDVDEVYICNGLWELFMLVKLLVVDWLVLWVGVYLLEYFNFCMSFSGFFKKIWWYVIIFI